MAVAVVVAAGRGERLGHTRPKALVPLAGRPMVQWSVDALRATSGVEKIVVVLPEDELSAAPDGVTAVAGGAVRSASVRNGLAALSGGDPVIVHDAARPLAEPALFARAVAELEATGADAVIAAAPVPDTLKAAEGGVVTRTVQRSGLWAVQTPQVFRRAALEAALADEARLAEATDDAWLVEQQGGTVRVLDPGEPNFKVTTAADLRLAELLLRERSA
jgi:2-C-methyl-D-erythritol 4-phosphate cytidylyltransferase